MLNLKQLERERAYLYKQQLKNQFEQKQALKKINSLSSVQKDKQELKQKIKVAHQIEEQQKRHQREIKDQVRNQNMYLAQYKQHKKQQEQSRDQEIDFQNNSSFMENLAELQNSRSAHQKAVHKMLNQSNLNDKQIHNQQYRQIKEHELREQNLHMKRLQELESQRKRQNDEIRQRHSQENGSTFEMHKKLQQLNDDYKKSLESFAYDGNDILDKLKRDDSQERYHRSRKIQSELKHQIDQKKSREAKQRSLILNDHQDLKQSLFKDIMYRERNDYKKPYGQYLSHQMKEEAQKRSFEKQQSKQEMSNLFGDKEGLERLKMMKYVDQNLGLESDNMKSFASSLGKSASPYRVKNLHSYNSGDPLNDHSRSRNLQSNEQSLGGQKLNNPEQQMLHSTNQEVTRVSVNSQLSQNAQDITKVDGTTPQQRKRYTPESPIKSQQKMFMSYDFIKGTSRKYEV